MKPESGANPHHINPLQRIGRWNFGLIAGYARFLTVTDTKARFEDRELLRRFQEVQELPDRDKEIVKELLDAFLTKRQIQQLAAR